MAAAYNGTMAYSVPLPCGCDVYVACHPISGIAHTREIERRHPDCPIRKHAVGTRVWLWELLPGGRASDDIAVDMTALRTPLR